MSAYGFKAQLKDVLSDAVSYFQDSGDPNDACVKAANAAGFNADQADRLVETFNTARTICHYKSADDKTSACSLADKETVRSQLTTPTESEKSAEYETADYGCYKQAEVDYVVPEVKLASTELKEEPLSKEASDWLRIREQETVRELMKTAEEEARLARGMADSLAEKVALALSRNVSIDDVHDKVARLVTAYATDDRYYPGVEKVAEFIPVASDPDLSLLKKYASRHVIDTSDLAPFLSAIKEASDFVAEAAALEAYVVEMAKEAGDGGSAPLSFVAKLKGMVQEADDSASKARIGKATDGVNNVRRQLILQDLLTTDKILSREDPNAVIAAFRSVHQISPDTTLNKEVLRSMLRSVVQSVALSPYDAKTLADVDKTRRQAYGETSIGGNGNA